MRKTRNYILLFGVLLGLLFPKLINATHLRAADITVKQIEGRVYEITLHLYKNSQANSDLIALNKETFLTINGQTILLSTPDTNTFPNNRNTIEYIYRYTTTLNAAKTLISYNEANRNEKIINLSTGSTGSEKYTLYVETLVDINVLGAQNSTPQLSIPPIDQAQIEEIYIHNPGAWDPDGDSLSFELVIPKTTSVKTDDVISSISAYVPPNEIELAKKSQFFIDPRTGIISWITPQIPGEYNIAFKVTEWRNGRSIGYVIRDMQILVKDGDNKRPLIIVPEDTCLVASDKPLIDTIIGYDQNRNPVLIQFLGQADAVGAKSIDIPITFPDSISKQFEWLIGCEDVQSSPVSFSFKVTDTHPTNPLTDSKNWLVSVYGPPVENFRVSEAKSNSLDLAWDNYVCENEIANLQLWRRYCDTTQILLEPCYKSDPEKWGFSLVEFLPANAVSYTDDNKGAGLLQGVDYVYILIASFKSPKFGVSLPSKILVGSPLLNKPILKKISYDTSSFKRVDLEWFAPKGKKDTAQYTVLQYDSIGDLLEKITFSSAENVVDTTFLVDTTFYRFSVVAIFEDTVGKRQIDTSSLIQTTYLEAEPSDQKLTLFLDLPLQWTYPDSLFTIVYERRNDSIFLIDSFLVSQTFFVVDSLENGTEYCYFTEVRSTFCHDSLHFVNTNFSNLACATPEDTVPPCPPYLFVKQVDCDFFDPLAPLVNQLSWIYPLSEECKDSISFYSVFEKVQDEMKLIETIAADTFYLHDSIFSLNKCYAITAIDRAGNESRFSNVACNDNCEFVDLPNVFTPDNDGKNDYFVPFPESRFIKEIKFEVYNRWGALVYQVQTGNLAWDGRNEEGKVLESGTYYYTAEVTFDKQDPEKTKQIFKSWVYITSP